MAASEKRVSRWTSGKVPLKERHNSDTLLGIQNSNYMVLITCRSVVFVTWFNIALVYRPRSNQYPSTPFSYVRAEAS